MAWNIFDLAGHLLQEITKGDNLAVREWPTGKITVFLVDDQDRNRIIHEDPRLNNLSLYRSHELIIKDVDKGQGYPAAPVTSPEWEAQFKPSLRIRPVKEVKG